MRIDMEPKFRIDYEGDDSQLLRLLYDHPELKGQYEDVLNNRALIEETDPDMGRMGSISINNFEHLRLVLQLIHEAKYLRCSLRIEAGDRKAGFFARLGDETGSTTPEKNVAEWTAEGSIFNDKLAKAIDQAQSILASVADFKIEHEVE
jgi:hypothetical protein